MPQEFFSPAYEGTPPWDIGAPQPAIVRAAGRELIGGRVIDIGCGTGENSLFVSALGHDVLGIDAVPRAIALAKGKAQARGLGARFVIHDALQLETLGERFDTAIDCGLFHTFSDEERPAYVASLGRVLSSRAYLLLLCFSDDEPGDWGPRRIRRDEIQNAFASGFEVVSAEATRFESRMHEGGAKAWFAVLRRSVEAAA